jgi:hypothetical protein
MADALSRRIYRQLFTESEWDLIYNFIGNALDDDTFDPDDVYNVRNKIHEIFEED